MAKFDPRAMMELAIEEMKKSIPEERDDDKVSPKVGAILVNIADEAPGYDRIMKAHRGELREGAHAEFTLLERKHRNRLLQDCVLFATLEPCAPGARKHPKLGCAERIVLARIKEVWIGIEDPDPTVDRKGIKFLQDNGVTVHMFDRDLQEIIRKENADFLKQALSRAEEEHTKEETALSQLEHARPALDWTNLSGESLEIYRDRAGITSAIGSDEFHRLLQRQGLAVAEGNVLKPSGFGNVLFAASPRDYTPQAAVLATIHYADGTEESKDFDGPQSMVPEQALQWLRDKLPNVMDRSDGVRKDKNDVIFTLVREGLVNAIVHRDYDLEQAKCQLMVYPSRIEIHSPGEPVPPITLEQMQDFTAPMLSRNPVMHFVFAKLRLAEERGLGLKSLRLKAKEAGLPLPRFSWNNPYLVLSIFLSADGATDAIAEDVVSELSPSELEGWKWLSSVGRSNSSQYAESQAVDVRTARRHLKSFHKLDLVRLEGSGPTTEYVVQ